MIPRRIHYCWYGAEPMDHLRRRCVESWRRLLPDYELKLWNESNSPLDEWYPSEAVRRGYWSRLSNYVRLHAVLTEGGIYLDTDVELLRPFDPLLHHDCFLGFQQEPEDDDWVNSATFGARPGHPFPARLLEFVVDALRLESRFLRGPEAATAVLREMGLTSYGRQTLAGGVELYPAPFFSPCPWFETPRPEQITAETYCLHHWGRSWRSSAEEQALL